MLFRFGKPVTPFSVGVSPVTGMASRISIAPLSVLTFRMNGVNSGTGKVRGSSPLGPRSVIIQ